MSTTKITLLALLILCSFLNEVQSAETTPATRYSLKNTARSSGSGNAFARVPFTKPYNELSPEQQASVKQSYEAMAEGDEPPFPVGGLQSLYEPVTRGFRRQPIKGVFYAELEVGADGVPTSMAVFKSPDPGITSMVSGIVLLSKFKPALCRGVPCAMGFPVHIGFERD